MSARGRAEQAKRELEETSAAFDAVRAAIVAKLVTTPPTETALMQSLVCAHQGLDSVQIVLQQVIDAHDIDELTAALEGQFPRAA